VKKYEPDREIGELDCLFFYKRAREVYAMVQMGEATPYGCIVPHEDVITD
jgi:L-fucose mutarotase/ribose pyranase (RbsD/FucU family)